ncbi:hypothetical protein [Noviherbaspirillum album]|nr:hypothetical protein [Noviherbaspirillum sp. CPCC 100848]
MKILGSSIDYSVSLRLPDTLKSQQQKEARRERAQNLPPNQLPPKLYLGGMVKIKRTMLQRDLEAAARMADERRSVRASPQAGPSAVPRLPISEAQLGRVRAALGNWIYKNGPDDARVLGRVAQATAFMKDVAQSTVTQDSEGRLRLFLPQRSSLSTNAHTALNNAGIDLDGAASPVSSVRSEQSGETAHPLPLLLSTEPEESIQPEESVRSLPSLPSVDPEELALSPPSGHTARSSMQAAPDSTPLEPINADQLKQVRSVVNAWVDAETSGGRISSQMIALATSLLWDAENSTVHQGTDGRLSLFLPQMGSLPTGLVTTLRTAGIDLHEASSPSSPTRSQKFPPSGAAVAHVQQASASTALGAAEELAHWRNALRDWSISLQSDEGRQRRVHVATNILQWIRAGDYSQALDLRGLKSDDLPPGFLQAFTGRLTNVQATYGEIKNAVMRELQTRGVAVNYPDSTTR